MAKKKIIRRKANKEIGIDFHSWTFFLFLLFVLVTTLILVAQQIGFRFL